MSTKEITVILPITRVSETATNSIQSILNQSFKSFELLIVCNCFDNEYDLINKTYSHLDKRIRLIKNINSNNDANIYSAFNIGFSLSKSTYICLTTEYSVLHPLRLEKQYEFMNSNLLLGISGGCFQINNKTIYPEFNSSIIKIKLLKFNCIEKSTLIIRNSFIKKHDLAFNCNEYSYHADFEFIARAAQYSSLSNLTTTIQHIYGTDNQTIENKNTINKKNEEYKKIVFQQIGALGIKISDNESDVCIKLLKGIIISYYEKSNLIKLTQKIIKANKVLSIFNHELFVEFINHLLKEQQFIKTNRNHTHLKTNKQKPNLLDFSFVIPVRIESEYRKQNFKILINYLTINFNTNIIVLEADHKPILSNISNNKRIKYYFVQDENAVFYRTKYINKLIDLAQTKYIGIWDTDAIVPTEQIQESVNILRNNQAVLVLPHDGRFYKTDIYTRHLLLKLLNNINLTTLDNSLELMYGYHSVGGAYLINKTDYVNAGGENEKIYGWGPEDAERVKRLEMLNLPVKRVSGAMYHLWHPIGINSRSASFEIGLKNHIEFIKTCQKIKII